MTFNEIFVLVLFILMYALMIILPKFRTYIALGAGVICLVFGMLPIGKALSLPDINVLLMITGIMGVAALFSASGMPVKLADLLLARTPDIRTAIVALSLLAGFISAFVDNVATVLMVAPVAIGLAKKTKTSPVPAVLAVSVASNLQGAATPVGDTTSMLLAADTDMSFADFIFIDGRPGIFWAVEIGALAAAAVLFFILRRETKKINIEYTKEDVPLFPTILLVTLLIVLIAVSFIPNKPEITSGLICLAAFVVGIIVYTAQKKGKEIVTVFKELDYETIGMLIGLFTVISAVTHVGLTDRAANLIASLCGDNLFIAYTIIVWGSVILSAFIDNIPYVASMLPVISAVSAITGGGTVLSYGLLIGATLGGNITPFGASANVVATGMLKKEGHTVSFGQFAKIGIPCTLIAAFAGYLMIWFTK